MNSAKILKLLDDEIDPITTNTNVMFSQKSRQFLKKIFEGLSKYKPGNVTPISIPNLSKSIQYANVPPSIQREIRNSTMKGFCSMFSISYRVVGVYIYAVNLDKTEARKMIQRIREWLWLAYQWAPEKCSQQLTIYIYLTDAQKVLPKKGENIEQTHANTAFTTPCAKQTEITIYRKEEWFKVFIHETFHCLGLDFSQMDNKETKDIMLSMFPVKSEVNLSETYCEVWAELINVMLILYRYIENFDDLINKTCFLMRYENMFSMFQCAKVLEFFDLPYEKLIEKKETEKYKEQTNVLSYYIIKTVLISNLNSFIEWCSTNNGVGGLCFSNNKKALVKYCELIRKHYKNPGLVSNIQKSYTWIKTNKKKSLQYELSTLRMSLIE